MKTFKLIFLAAFIAISTNQINAEKKSETKNFPNEQKAKAFFSKELKFTVLYDNYKFKEGTKTNWGFSCLIEGEEMSMLFDTGANPKTLFKNIESLNADLSKLKYVFISHNHYDHTGGLAGILKKYKGITVFVTKSFPQKAIENYEALGAKIMKTDKAKEIFKNVYTTGEMGVDIKEQSLIFDTDKGAIIVTGCSHQGIINILNLVEHKLENNIHLVFGGFHLLRHGKDEVDEIVKEFKEVGVEKCGATHCTGGVAINKFKEAFGDNYVKVGTGKVITIKQ